ncbi:RPB5 subunit of DNA-directed RNA polymerase [Neocallimastix lanati (nom. inval.)]|jgi:DNA-directed RNA polymerase I, II, and III subunit RPABC1|uniref:DNA-directed RNA polymerases I, II, and III subunit RPABC1 n=1 Tax=Neocallimastix californiae TaxID=1754190 RepID=A0A1Y2CXG0_9FUNG|nr:RPB5 subunit of DNA-directed RNA polymerase [Neocallimastix sp. JGI-2020a]ORY51713.1 RPB5 subunit of DNA-directed RNA polymerase [Neocallimastix californiae]|eukprot:ORY51713.1 RPB5 subunit of DNA-directed RNA polymerase [Neocallimastix californiae]
MDSDAREVTKLYRAYKTIHEMVHDRGYLVSQNELDMTLQQFQEKYAQTGVVERESLTFLVQKKDDPADSLLVFFPSDETVGVKPIRKYTERMSSQEVLKGIIVYQKNLTPSAQKVITQMAPKYLIEIFSDSELLVNITRHSLVPKHVVLTNDEKKMLLERYKLKELQLPRIQPSDPVARYYGLRKGQVVKILRSSETAGRYITYRLCI